jgi:hypothetical protein
MKQPMKRHGISANRESRWRLFWDALIFAALIASSVFVVLPARAVNGSGRLGGCLHSTTDARPFRLYAHPECSKDQLELATNPAIQKTEEFLKLKTADIAFVGCADAPMSTIPAEYRVTITYPIHRDSESTLYIPAILHELGHAYQLQHAGDEQHLEESSELRIELGADFLAGLASRHISLNPGAFEASLFLFGSYKPDEPDPHGRPEERSASFRYGYHYSPAETVGSAYQDFQDNLFGQAKHN